MAWEVVIRGMARAPAKRRSHHHGNLHAALVVAAVACIEKSGMQGLTLREVARIAGVSHQAPYHHFPDRASLVAAVAESGFRGLRDDLGATLLRAGDDPDDVIDALVTAYVRFAIEHRTLFRVMFSPEVADKSPYPSLQLLADANLGLLTKAVAAAQKAQRIGPGDVLDYAAATWALAHGLAGFLVDGQLRRRGFDVRSADATARRLMAVLRDGLRPHRDR